MLIKGQDHLYSIRPCKTKRRRLDVHFGTILMNDDSDDLSDGEFKFGFFVDNNNKPQGKPLRFPGDGSEISIGTGKTKTIDVNATVFDSDFVTLAATGVDDDDDPSPNVDTEGIIRQQTPMRRVAPTEFVSGFLAHRRSLSILRERKKPKPFHSSSMRSLTTSTCIFR